jgi:hypothetical protein
VLCPESRPVTGRGPGDRSGQGGSSGSISAHESSSTIHGRVLTASRTAESPAQSRPTRATEQDRVTSSKGVLTDPWTKETPFSSRHRACGCLTEFEQGDGLARRKHSLAKAVPLHGHQSSDCGLKAAKPTNTAIQELHNRLSRAEGRRPCRLSSTPTATCRYLSRSTISRLQQTQVEVKERRGEEPS